jgi:hypothetical protein
MSVCHSSQCTMVHTYNQTLHLIFSLHLYTERFCYPVIVLERATACRHDTELLWCRPIVVFVIGLQLAHKLYACIYPVRLELEEVQSAANSRVARFPREVHEFCK